MNDNGTLARFLAFAVLTCCAGMALCVSLLGVTWATGELPFGIAPLLRDGDPKLQAVVDLDDQRERFARQRHGEVYASRLFAALEAERERLAQERILLQDRERTVGEMEKALAKIAAEVQAAEQRVRFLLDYTDETEQANVRRLSAILAASEPQSGARLLLSVPPKMAARLIEAMDTRRAAEVMATLTTRSSGAEATKVQEILGHLQRLASSSPP